VLKSRYRVWLVDDREINRKSFERDHGENFEVTTFETPTAVIRALETRKAPDALLCDLYFYADPDKREEIEHRPNLRTSVSLRDTPCISRGLE